MRSAALRFTAVAATWCLCAARAETLTVRIEHTFHDAPLRTEEMSLRQADGSAMSITRLEYLITEFALLQPDGRALLCDGQAAYLNPTRGLTSFTLPGVPPGNYAGVAFRIGVPKELNHREPSSFAAGSALNPLVNGLHWGWQGGFVFLALEGRYGQQSGYSYHIARDENLMTVRLPGEWKCEGDTEITLRFDAAGVLADVMITPENGGDSTHSAVGDMLAARLKKNVENAFTLLRSAAVNADGSAALTLTTTRPPGTTPFPFRVPAGFPQPRLPADNPLTLEGVSLGGRLFRDPRLSGNQTQSCASCHQPERAFSEQRAVSIGAEGQPGIRNAPTLTNLAWHSSYAWDGRRERLREQAVAPISDALEMHQPLNVAVDRLAGDPSVVREFTGAFGSAEVTAERLGLALEQYLLTQIAGDSKFDRAMRGGPPLSAEEQRGFELFNTEFDPARGRRGADCFHCHGGYTFSDFAFHDTGLDQMPRDAGRFAATRRESDRGKFKTPSLRNVAITAPYMHDGRFSTLEAVLDHYDHGVQRTSNLDPNLAKHPPAGLELSDADKDALLAFLRTLTEPAFETHPAATAPLPPLPKERQTAGGSVSSFERQPGRHPGRASVQGGS